MTILKSKIDPKSETFLQNAENMRQQVETLKTALAWAYEGGGPKAQAIHESRGKLCHVMGSIN